MVLPTSLPLLSSAEIEATNACTGKLGTANAIVVSHGK